MIREVARKKGLNPARALKGILIVLPLDCLNPLNPVHLSNLSDLSGFPSAHTIAWFGSDVWPTLGLTRHQGLRRC